MPGGLVRGLVGDGLGDELGVVPAVVLHHGVGGVVGPAAAGVGEEMVDGDVGDVGLVGRLAVLVAEDAGGAEDFVGEVELALLDEGEDGDGGDGLGDGGDAEEGVLLGLGEMLAVGHADGLVVDEVAVAGDGDGGGGDARIGGGIPRRGDPSRRAAGRWSLRIGVERGICGRGDDCGGGAGEVSQEGSAGERVDRHWPEVSLRSAV